MNKGMQVLVALIIMVFTVGMAGVMYVYLPYVLWTSDNSGLAIVYILWNVVGPMVLKRMKSTLYGFKK